MVELVEEILLRLPPEEPMHLFRAAAVYKAWRTMLSDSSSIGFLHRYHKFHRTPTFGYLHNTYHHPQFIATTSTPSLSAMPAARNVVWEVLDCRHGRVLMQYTYGTSSLVFIIWDPITRARKHVVVHDRKPNTLTAAVICAIDDCDHLDCHGGPIDSIVLSYSEFMHWSPSLFIGDALYFTLNGGVSTSTLYLKFDLGSHRLSMVDTPEVHWDAVAIKAEDGGLGFVAVLEDNCIYLWSWKQANDGGCSANGTIGGGGRWARHKAMDLNKLALLSTSRAPFIQSRVIGYIEGTNTIFINTYNTGVFTLDLKSSLVPKSSLVRKVEAEGHMHYCILPYTSLYTPSIISF
ncbi:hypothetical protein BS78_02G019300 [Paspalum vaginatum]|nr:hypothetical protein BS78_02G019300 [Paspalum vaginatum]